ncbi:MAG: TlpA disulfide reductase family protein [Acidobacteria bacterium]|nr:TlpA disulfide reductase family protein [Acidobacteriota bacterium]
MNRRNHLAAPISILLISIWLPAAGMAGGTGTGAGEWDVAAKNLGKLVPDFTLKTIDGEVKHLAEMRGNKVVLVVLWAVWCPPCIEEVPILTALQNKYRDRGLEVLGLGVPYGQNEKAIRGFMKRNEVSYSILFDENDEVTSKLGAIYVPYSYLIAPDGTLAYEGSELPPDLERRIETLLDKLPASVTTASARG